MPIMMLISIYADIVVVALPKSSTACGFLSIFNGD